MAGHACTNIVWYNGTAVSCTTGVGARDASGPIVVCSLSHFPLMTTLMQGRSRSRS